MDDKNREKLMDAEREKSIRQREKGAKQGCTLEEQMIGGVGGDQDGEPSRNGESTLVADTKPSEP